MTEPVPDNEAFLVGIDPDSKKSGVAVCRQHDKYYSLHNFEFFELFEFLQKHKTEIRLVVIEAGWLNKSVWHGAGGKKSSVAAKIGNSVGRNHETARKTEEMCKYLKIHYELVRPVASKLSADAFAKFTGIQERTNQEQRDAFMLVFGR